MRGLRRRVAASKEVAQQGTAGFAPPTPKCVLHMGSEHHFVPLVKARNPLNHDVIAAAIVCEAGQDGMDGKQCSC